MRHCGALGVGLLTWVLVGCASGPAVEVTAGWKGAPAAGAEAPPAFVQLEIALLECPLADSYINRDLWAFADEQVIAPERRSGLEDNGFRVAQLGGILPPQLRSLLVSKRSNVNPRRLLVRAGRSVPLYLGPRVPALRYDPVRDGEPLPEVRVEQAQSQLAVLPTLAPDGKARLRFTPKVEYGEQLLTFHPAKDDSGWMMEPERPHHSYPELSWEVTLAPNQYLVIGTRFEQRRSLGFASLVQLEESNPVQRLLVIRTFCPGAAPAPRPGEGPAEETAADPAPTPALLAQLPSPRVPAKRP
jgi:hypothetical protein